MVDKKKLSEIRSEANRKAAATRRRVITETAKTSLLQSRLLSRAMVGARTAALKREPTLISVGITNPKLITIEPKDFDRLEVPPYQRGIQPDEVNELLRAIKAGGMVADPITLSRRLWVTQKPESEKLWIVDGQQRVLAHMEANVPIKAIVYDCNSPEAERNLFVIMNTQRVVSPNNIINAASSKTAQLLRNVNENPDHPCYRRIIMTTAGNNASRNMGAAIILRGLAQALGVGAFGRAGTAQKLLPRIDESFDLQRADCYLRTIAEVTPIGLENRLRLLPALAIGKVFHEKFLSYGRLIEPSKLTLSNIRRTNWYKVTEGRFSRKYLPVALEEIRGKWKA